MDSDKKVDILGELMSRDEGPCRFVANCFLLLSPEELKACRLVSTTWAGFILEDLWKSSWGRRELREKLVTRWKTVDPMNVQLNQVQGMQSVSSIFSTDAHVFCGFHGKVAVYDLSTGLLVKELTPPDKERPNYSSCSELAGGDGIVAACMHAMTVVTVWSTQPDKMVQLHCFEVLNYHCQDPTCEHGDVAEITVVNRHKVAFLVAHSDWSKASLVVLEMVGDGWVNKTLTCFSSQTDWLDKLKLASDSDWLALLDSSNKKLRLWDGDNVSSPEVVLPGWDGLSLGGMSVEFPHLVVFFRKTNEVLIKVYQMGDSVPSLVKTILFQRNKRDYCSDVTAMANKTTIGFLTYVNDVSHIFLYNKRDLYDRRISPEETSRRQINIRIIREVRAAINTTSIVFAEVERDEVGRALMRKDFWMTNDINMQT